MRPLMLDYRRSTLPGGLGWLVLAAGSMLALAALAVFVGIAREVEDWQAQAAKAVRPAQRDAAPGASAGRQQDLQQAHAVLQQLALPWESLFAALEATRGDKVALLSLEPEVGKGQVRIGAEAKTATDMLDYLRRLQEQSGFAEVVLLNHQIQTQDAERPLRFTVVAMWGSKP